MATVNGTSGNDNLITTGDPNGDDFNGGLGNDRIRGGSRDDTSVQNVTTDGLDQVTLGNGDDVATITADAPTNVRLTFTSSEVGNASPIDGGTMANQNGGIAVRLQAEADGELTGPVSRYDDEGISFEGGAGVTFDVRDLVSGAERGEAFNVVTLGTQLADLIDESGETEAYYINGGQGADTITGGTANDFLVGGAGDDILSAADGDDRFIGGGGNDTITGGAGIDTVAAFNVSTDGTDTVDLGTGLDVVNVSAAAGTSQVRLSYAGGGIGDGVTTGDDGGLAIMLQAEAGGVLTGPVSRFDDEGVIFVATGPGLTFANRDSGIERGDTFRTVGFGSADSDFFSGTNEADYLFGGNGSDIVLGGDGNDFLVGQNGDDTLNGGAGLDILVGGAGNDQIDSLDRPASLFAGVIAPERDTVLAGDGDDQVTGGRLDQLDGGAGNDFLLVNFDFNGPFVGTPPQPRPAVDLTLDASGTGTANDGTSITGFENLNLFLTDSDDSVDTGDVRATLSGAGGDDVLTTGAGTVQGFSFGGTPPLIGDDLSGGAGSDQLSSGDGNDTLNGGTGADLILGGEGDDIASVNRIGDGADDVDLGGGDDEVQVRGEPGQVRLTFTSSEVGNGDASDAGELTNQDGRLAVRFQAEDATGALSGPIARYDDEGIRFIAGTQGTTFDVRDLVSGAQRGDQFESVFLGTELGEDIGFDPFFFRFNQAAYVNAGQGNDVVRTGSGDDFLVGGGGDDQLVGGAGDDSFIGGAGADLISGGGGVDRIAAFNVTTDGADSVNLGSSQDIVNVTATAPTQVRLSFTSTEAGNGLANDSGTMANQDGGLGIRLQAEDGSDAVTGPLSRFDDEGNTFVGGAGVTFEVRDLVSNVVRGQAFEVVIVGTLIGEALSAVQADRSYYINAGQGADLIAGGNAADFLVGGAGDDDVFGNGGNDQFLLGGGDDFAEGNDGDDTIGGGDGADALIGGAGVDTLTGDAGRDYLQGDAGADVLIGGADGDELQGGDGDDILAGQDGDDVIVGGEGFDQVFADAGNDFVSGGGGGDILEGRDGNDVIFGDGGADFLVGNGGADVFAFALVSDSGAGGLDIVGDFETGVDKLDLRSLRTSAADVVAIQTFDTFQLVTLDQGGDGSIEFSVQVNDTIVQSDFLL